MKTFVKEKTSEVSTEVSNPTTVTLGVTEKELMTTKELAKTLGVDVKTIQRAVNSLDMNVARVGSNHTMVFTEEQATAIKIELQNHSKIAKNGFNTMTVKELATSLNVAESTVKNTIQELRQVLGEVSKNSQGGYLLNEKQATMIKLKLRERTNLKDNSVVSQITNDLEFMALLKKREEENKILDAYRDMRIEQLTKELRLAETEKENLKIELDESKEWYSIKRMQKLNPDREFNWRLLKQRSEDMGVERKEVFDQNYGNVKAYHVSVWEDLFYDTINY